MMSEDEEDDSAEAQLVPEEDTEAVRKLKAIHCIAWFDAIQACFLLAYYGQMYAAYGWCPSNMICIKDSFWDLDIIEGATWFGIFVVYAIQLIAAINLCHVTKRPGVECLRERCQSWYDASKILSKVLVIECFILFVPHSKPYIFNWWVFLVKAIFRAIAVTSVFHFMVDLRHQEAMAIRNNVTGGAAAASNSSSTSSTFIPILSTPTHQQHHHHHQRSGATTTTTTSTSFPGQHMAAIPSSTSIYIGAGLEFNESLDYSRFQSCNSPSPDDDPPPPYSEAIKNCKEEDNALLLHV